MDNKSLFQSFSLKSLNIKNRIVMAPMTRSFSPSGIPGQDVVAYYQKRAEGHVGLILSEGTVINRISSSNEPDVPHFYGEKALGGWQNVIDSVHTAGSQMGPQIWHMGVMADHASGWKPSAPFEGPSGILNAGVNNGTAMSEDDIVAAVAAFGQAAADAKSLGFDCVEIHGAHGYLIDQFFWQVTNQRTDGYGGKSLSERNRFAAEVIQEIRRRVGEDFTIILRISQFKLYDLAHKLAATPKELEAWLMPLSEAGVDIFHCSQRRFWEPEFEGSDLNFAGWAKKITGKATITVGSVGLDGDAFAAFAGESSNPSSLDELIKRLERGDFDLVAVGRPLLADPNWVVKIQEARFQDLRPFTKEDLTHLSIA